MIILTHTLDNYLIAILGMFVVFFNVFYTKQTYQLVSINIERNHFFGVLSLIISAILNPTHPHSGSPI